MDVFGGGKPFVANTTNWTFNSLNYLKQHKKIETPKITD
jgi:hypothetical protein